MIKIKHNFKILADGKTIRGQVLDCIFPTGRERGDCHKYSLKVDNDFYIRSSYRPKLDIRCDYILYVWGTEKEKDYDVIEYRYSTEWQAKKVMKHIEEFTIKEEKMIIKTKEDFDGKYIKLPTNISKKKFDKILNKFKRLGFDIFRDNLYNKIKKEEIYLERGFFINTINTYDYDTHNNSWKQISIKDFLREEKPLFVSSKIWGVDADFMLVDHPIEANLHIDAKEWELDKLNKDSYVFRKRPYKEYINNISIDTANGNIIVHNKKPIDILIHYRIIESLDEEGYTLKKPFEVIIKKDPNDGDYIGIIDELGIHCWDKDKEEVIKEIKKEILDLYDDLVLDLRWELGKEPKRWRKILKKHIKYKKVSYEG